MARKAKATNGARPVRRPAHRTRADVLLTFMNQLAGLHTLDEQLKSLVEVSSEVTDADRCTVFLHDASARELYARIAQGDRVPGIRIPDSAGIVGHVFTTGASVLIPDAYADPRFDPAIDEKTGYKTVEILSTPLRTNRGELLGVAQALNKRNGRFTPPDLDVLESFMQQ